MKKKILMFSFMIILSLTLSANLFAATYSNAQIKTFNEFGSQKWVKNYTNISGSKLNMNLASNVSNRSACKGYAVSINSYGYPSKVLYVGFAYGGDSVAFDPAKVKCSTSYANSFYTKIIQYNLKTLGYKDYENKKLVVDGDYGGRTKSAVKKFQKKNNIEDDGVVGENTWYALSCTNK